MMSEHKPFSKDSFLGIAKTVGDAAKSVGTGAKNIASSFSASVKESKDQRDRKKAQEKFENDLKKYAPIQKEEISSSSFTLPSVVRIVGDDVRRHIEACAGAVGFYTGEKEFKILNIYREHLDLLGNLKWYPLEEEAVYHVDPCYKKLYIRLDEYFSYLKKVRVDELISIAHDLGAKHVEIVLKETKSSFSHEQHAGDLTSKRWSTNLKMQKTRSSTEASGLEVAAQVDFKGNDCPIKPKTVYFKNEHDIQNLIRMRLSSDQGNTLLSKKYSFRYGSSSGIKVSDAQKIDVALSAIDVNLSHTFLGEASAENNTLLEYSIDF